MGEIGKHYHRNQRNGGRDLRHRISHAHEVLVTDRGGEARVLGQVQVLTDRRRDDYPHGLGKRDVTQGRPGRQTHRSSRLGLPLADRLNAGSNDLGNERRCIYDQPDQQCRETPAELRPALRASKRTLRRGNGDCHGR